jgi:hypothetical protein
VAHFGELSTVTTPLVLAAAITWWFALLSVMTGLWWAIHEARTTRRRRTLEPAGVARH